MTECISNIRKCSPFRNNIYTGVLSAIKLEYWKRGKGPERTRLDWSPCLQFTYSDIRNKKNIV